VTEFAHTLEQIRRNRAELATNPLSPQIETLAKGLRATLGREVPTAPVEMTGAVALVISGYLAQVGMMGVPWPAILMFTQWAAADLCGVDDPWPPKPGEVWQATADGHRWTPVPGFPMDLMRITGEPSVNTTPFRAPADEVARRTGPLVRLLAAPAGGWPA
jgi:hypothetical protein